MHRLIYVLLTSLMTIAVGVGSFLITSTALVLIVRLLTRGALGLEGILFAEVAIIIGLLAALLSLIPSYKLSLKLADYLRKRGMVEIKNPKKMFLVALLIPFLLLAFLIIWGAVVMK